MNLSSIVGLLSAIAVLGFAITESEGSKEILLNAHALMIVIGGTGAAAFISFPIGQIFRLSWLALKRLVGVTHVDYSPIIRDVISVAEGIQKDPGYLKANVNSVKHPFFREGLQLLLDGATEEQLTDILETRAETTRRRHNVEVNMFRTIGKFPPAFGLLGTTFGMINLLSKLGGEDAQKMVGPAMAVGLVATLYGIGLTNFLFIPIAENLNAMSAVDFASRKMILNGVVLIKRKTHPILVEEKMKSYLLPGERAGLKLQMKK